MFSSKLVKENVLGWRTYESQSLLPPSFLFLENNQEINFSHRYSICQHEPHCNLSYLKEKGYFHKGEILFQARWVKFSAAMPSALCTSASKKAGKPIQVPV